MRVVSHVVSGEEGRFRAQVRVDRDIRRVIEGEVKSERGAVHVVNVVDCPTRVGHIRHQLVETGTGTPNRHVSSIIIDLFNCVKNKAAE